MTWVKNNKWGLIVGFGAGYVVATRFGGLGGVTSAAKKTVSKA